MNHHRTFLYISCKNKEQYSGGGQCTERNLSSLYSILGKENVDTHLITPKFGRRTLREKITRLVEVCQCLGGGLTQKEIKNIISTLEKKNYTDVFIDSSALGVLAKIIKKRFPHIRIYVFFHNVEYDYMVSTTLLSKDYKHLFWIASARYNEVQACRYADEVISLNQSDMERIHRLYKKDSSIIPITMEDDYAIRSEALSAVTSTPPSALFVGSYFPGNIKGLKRFCEEILPYANIHLTIVGSGMEQFKNDTHITNKMSLYGRVEDLAAFYEKADVVILPIISGGGMKVKTAEALKFGKYIIGTKEALEGYDVTLDIATVCNSKEEFIHAINTYSRVSKYNIKSRELFKSKYSYQISLELFTKLFRP